MNGHLNHYQVFIARYVEEMVEVEAETEHEAVTSISGPRDKIMYIRKLEAPTEDGPADQPSL